MKIQDLREMTDSELEEKIEDLRSLLFKRRFESHDEQTKNPGEVRMAKKDIARIKTLLTERKIPAGGKETEAAAAPAAAGEGSGE
jgi:large subunit ribosomal protein L29